MQAERIIARCRELARITDVPGQTTRPFLSHATREAQALLSGWMRAAGLTVTVDAIGNVHGMAAGGAGKPRLIVASHLDTVVDAGAFDGPLGILLGLEIAEATDADDLPFAIEVIAFSEEEGVRFRKPFLGSLALIGEPVAGSIADADGVTLAEVVAAFGLKAAPPPQLHPDTFAYLEIHIEQGPVLEAEARPLAAVHTIAGQTRMRVAFSGHANHAGTTPMHLRRDALAAAAHWITMVEAYAQLHPGLVATVGGIDTRPGLGNVISGLVTASLDLRHGDDELRRQAVKALVEAAHAAAEQRGVVCTIEPGIDQAAVRMDPQLTAGLVEAAASAGYDATPMLSGAGHDAMILARRVPTAMLFVRTPGGLSHHPDETVLAEDVEAALQTTLSFVHSLKPTAVAVAAEATHA
jgi:allantoate deiminase